MFMFQCFFALDNRRRSGRNSSINLPCSVVPPLPHSRRPQLIHHSDMLRAVRFEKAQRQYFDIIDAEHARITTERHKNAAAMHKIGADTGIKFHIQLGFSLPNNMTLKAAATHSAHQYCRVENALGLIMMYIGRQSRMQCMLCALTVCTLLTVITPRRDECWCDRICRRNSVHPYLCHIRDVRTLPPSPEPALGEKHKRDYSGRPVCR